MSVPFSSAYHTCQLSGQVAVVNTRTCMERKPCLEEDEKVCRRTCCVNLNVSCLVVLPIDIVNLLQLYTTYVRSVKRRPASVERLDVRMRLRLRDIYTLSPMKAVDAFLNMGQSSGVDDCGYSRLTDKVVLSL